MRKIAVFCSDSSKRVQPAADGMHEFHLSRKAAKPAKIGPQANDRASRVQLFRFPLFSFPLMLQFGKKVRVDPKPQILTPSKSSCSFTP